MKNRYLTFVLLAFLVSGCRGATPEPSTQTDAAVASEPASSVAIRNARTPARNLLTGGQPTEEQIREIAAAGYQTVVNLRPHDEEGAWDEGPLLTELGVRYVHIPVAGGGAVTRENAEKLAKILDDEGAYPLVVHCASGNRVGGLMALKAFHLDGEDNEAALQIGREAGMTKPALEEVVSGRMTRSP